MSVDNPDIVHGAPPFPETAPQAVQAAMEARNVVTTKAAQLSSKTVAAREYVDPPSPPPRCGCPPISIERLDIALHNHCMDGTIG